LAQNALLSDKHYHRHYNNNNNNNNNNKKTHAISLESGSESFDEFLNINKLVNSKPSSQCLSSSSSSPSPPRRHYSRHQGDNNGMTSAIPTNFKNQSDTNENKVRILVPSSPDLKSIKKKKSLSKLNKPSIQDSQSNVSNSTDIIDLDNDINQPKSSSNLIILNDNDNHHTQSLSDTNNDHKPVRHHHDFHNNSDYDHGKESPPGRRRSIRIRKRELEHQEYLNAMAKLLHSPTNEKSNPSNNTSISRSISPKLSKKTLRKLSDIDSDLIDVAPRKKKRPKMTPIK